MQGLCEWLLSRDESGANAGAIDAHIRETPGFEKTDKAHYDTPLHGAITHAGALREVIAPHLDRPIAELSPIEHGMLLVGAWELTHHIEIPYRVVINEAVELAKSFGGTDGFKYVNGVLDPFSLRSGLVRPLDGLADVAADAEFHKSRHSALVGTGLSVWLRERGIGRLIVSGIRTEQCCETTTRHASDEGFEVDFVPDATLTFDMKHLDGSSLPARDIVARTCAVLTERFARISSVDEALERATR